MVSHPAFKGRQVIHVAQELGNDAQAYDYIDTYTIDQHSQQTHQLTGRQISIRDKPIEFWANYIQIDLTENDTLDVYIRLKGMNLNYQPENIKLWHIDFDSIFSSQIFLTKKAFIFYGMLGIQILFFIFLYLIENEKIYLYFSIFGLGFFLSRAFSEFNFSSFVPFPITIPYNEPLYHSSIYLTLLGGLLFISQYLNIPKNGLFMRRVVPIYLILTLTSFLRFIFRYSFSEAGTYPGILTPAAYTFSALLLGIYMIWTSPNSVKRSKFFLLISILPIIMGSTLTLVYNEGWLPPGINAIFVDDFMKIAIILLIVTLALTFGYRSRALKSEKEAAIQENLKAKQTIFEKQVHAEKLEEMNDLKTRLYTNITHEFRTPLTVIMGINDELSDTTKSLKLPKGKKKKILQNQQLIQRNSQNLLTLVNQLLDLSKSDSK